MVVPVARDPKEVWSVNNGVVAPSTIFIKFPLMLISGVGTSAVAEMS